MFAEQIHFWPLHLSVIRIVGPSKAAISQTWTTKSWIGTPKNYCSTVKNQKKYVDVIILDFAHIAPPLTVVIVTAYWIDLLATAVTLNDSYMAWYSRLQAMNN